MNITGHLNMAAGTYLYSAALIPQLEVFNHGKLIWLAGLAVTLFGSTLPDIDHPKSTIGRKLPWISKAIANMFGHRGITHSLFAIVSMLYMIDYFFVGMDKIILILLPCFAIGYLSHLFADMLTPAGIPLLYPFKVRFKLPIVQNSSIEAIVYTLFLSSSLYFYFYKNDVMSFVDKILTL